MADRISSFLDQYGGEQQQPPAPAQEPETPIQSFLDQYEQPPVAQPVDVPEPTKAPSEIDVPTPTTPEFRARAVTERVKKGFADFAALPGYAVDIINWPLHKLGLTPEKAVGGSDMIRKGWQLLTGYQEIEPRTKTERYLGSAAEFMGGGLVPGAGIVGQVAKRGVPLVAGASPEAIRKAYQISGGAAQIPKMAAPATTSELAGVVGVEAASAITGGVAAEFGGEVGEQAFGQPGRVAGQMIFGMAGGMAPVYYKTAGGAIWNSTRAMNTVTKDRANFMENVAKAKIVQAIGENPQAPENIKRAAQLQKEITGFDPNLAAATGSPGLAQMQSRLDAQSIEHFNVASENIRRSQEAIQHYYDEIFSTTGMQIKATKTFRQTLKGLKETAGDIDKQIQTLSESYQRQPTEQIGQRLRELRQIRKTTVRGDVNQAYDDLYDAAEDLGVIDDASDLYQLAQEFTRQDATVFQRMPSIMAKMRQIFGRELDADIPIEDQRIMTSFPKMHSLYREVSKQYGKALKSGDDEKQYYLGQIKELLDDKLSAFNDPVYGTFAEHKKAVDGFWLNEYYNVFKKGVGGKIPYETRWGQTTPDEQIVSKLVMQKGTARGIDEFNKVYENVPEAQELLRNGIIDMFASKVEKTGKIDQTQIRNFLTDYKEVFNKLPDLRNAFLNSEALTNTLVNRQANVIKKTKRFAQATISPYAKIAGFDTPHAAVEAGLRDPKIMRILTRNAKTMQERQDISSIVADIVMEQPDPWKYIIENEDQLAKHFNALKPGHFRKLKNIAEANSILGRYKPPDVQRKQPPDPFYRMFGTTFASALAQWRWALLYNKTSVYYPAADMGTKYLQKIKANKVDELLERSLYDPDLATTLDELAKTKPTQMGDLKIMDLLGRLGQHAINNGIRTSSVAMPEEE